MNAGAARRRFALGSALRRLLLERRRDASARTLGERLAGLPVVLIPSRDVARAAGLSVSFVMKRGRVVRARPLSVWLGDDVEYSARYVRGVWRCRPCPAPEL